MKSQRNTLLLTSQDGRVRSLAFNPRYLVPLTVTAVVLLIGGTLFGGICLGIGLEARAQLGEVHDLQAQTGQQQQAIEQLGRASHDHLDALALRLGRMQAQVMRLEAIGKHLVDAVDLDAGEFDFGHEPSRGGPGENAPPAEHDIPDFLAMIEQLEHGIIDRRQKLSLMEQLIVHRQVNRRITPSGLVVDNGLLSSRFGTRIDPFTGKRGTHKGIDIAGRAGSTILAAGDGLVTFSGHRKGYGNLVEVDHGDGYVTRYAHNRSHLVETGETVRKGQPLALMGSTGRSTGPHVHVEVLKHGKQVNPTRYLAY